MTAPPTDCPIPGAQGFCRPEGTGANGVLILGEACGEAEAHESLPFRPFAQAGSLLERAIKRAGYTREQFVVYNAVPTQPPNNYLEGASYEQAAIEWGRQYVRDAIAQFKPRCILAVGAVALRACTGLCGPYRSISHLRGYVIPSVFDIPVVPSFHPIFLRHGAMALFPVLMHDLKLAVTVAALQPGQTGKFFSPVLWRDAVYTRPTELRAIEDPLVPPGYRTHPSEQQAWDYLLAAEKDPELLIAYDIETPRSAVTAENESDELADVDIISIQFSLAPKSGIFMPWREPFIEISRKLLALPNPKGGANVWRFDDPLLRAHGCPVAGTIHDVRWAWHHLQPDMKGALQFISSFYGMEQPWKQTHQSHPQYYGIADVDAIQRILL